MNQAIALAFHFGTSSICVWFVWFVEKRIAAEQCKWAFSGWMPVVLLQTSHFFQVGAKDRVWYVSPVFFFQYSIPQIAFYENNNVSSRADISSVLCWVYSQ